MYPDQTSKKEGVEEVRRLFLVAQAASRVWPLRLTSLVKVPSDQRVDNEEAFDNAFTSSECLVYVGSPPLHLKMNNDVAAVAFRCLPQPLSSTRVRSAGMANETCGFAIE